MKPKRMCGRLADESMIFAHRKTQEGWNNLKIAAWLNVSQQAVSYKVSKYQDLMLVDRAFQKTEALYCEQDFLSRLKMHHRRTAKAATQAAEAALQLIDNT